MQSSLRDYTIPLYTHPAPAVPREENNVWKQIIPDDVPQAEEIERLRQWEIVGREWLDKTDWMQSKDAPVRWLGKHRADALRDEIERLTAERDDLRRQLDEAEQDARRYRYWLRGGANIPSHSARWARWEVRYWNGRHWNPLFAEQMDAAIDAAMRLTRG